MIDALVLGRNYKPIPFEGELKDSRISVNKATQDAAMIVTEQCNFDLTCQVDPDSEPYSIKLYQSRLGQFEKLEEIKLTEDALPKFNPNFEDDNLGGFNKAVTAFHRVVDVHSSGAILFYSNIVSKGSDGIVNVEDAGFFLQARYDTVPIPIPEEAVLGFTEDSTNILLCCLDEARRTKILLFQPEIEDFKNVKFSDDVTEFLGGALDGHYLCMIADDGPDGTSIPHLADFKTQKMRKVSNFEQIVSLSMRGVLVGHSLNLDGMLEAGYVHPNGKIGALAIPDISNLNLSPYLNGVSSIELGDAPYHLVAGSGANIETHSDPLFGVSLNAEHRVGLVWIASETELRMGLETHAQPIHERVLGAKQNFINVSDPTSDMRLVGHTEDEQVLLIPVD